MSRDLYLEAVERFKPTVVVGVDEVGLGAWAGPVYVAAVMFGAHFEMEGLADSKQLKPEKREEMFRKVKPFTWNTRWFDPVDIDSLGIEKCIEILNKRLVGMLCRFMPSEEYLVVFDGDLDPHNSLPRVPFWSPPIRAISIPKADTCVPAVMAASIMAKVSRDGIMKKVPDPGYGYANHKGYGTNEHKQALETLGPSEFHRFSYKPVAEAHRIFQQEQK